MGEVTNERLLQPPRAIRAKLVEHDHRLDELASDLRSLKPHMPWFMSSEVNQDGTIAELRERIERRLEITD